MGQYVSTSDKEDGGSSHGMGSGSLNNLIGAEKDFIDAHLPLA
jgi:hypothetical protein